MRQQWLRRFQYLGLSLCLICGCLNRAVSVFADDTPAKAPASTKKPLSDEVRSDIDKQLDASIQELTEQIAARPDVVSLYSSRGDAYFFRGKFKESVADYEKMVELNADLDTGHWRRGIARFYAGDYKKAAHQFEIYHTFDDVDRENGIWRFLSQVRAYNLEKAREGLLKYEKDDREPFPAVYQLFAGKITPKKILEDIAAAKISPEEREKRLFYAELYIGLNYAVEKQPELARPHLAAAVRNEWGRTAGYGPSYMWNVGRVHYDLLTAEAKKPSDKPAE